MSEFYFFEKDENCRWLRKEITESFPKYLHEPVEHNGATVKFYVILEWVLRDNRGANRQWIHENGYNVVETVNDLPEGAGVYITGYDSDVLEVKKLREKGVPIIDHACPWVANFRNQLLEHNQDTHQCIMMLDRGHMVYDCLKKIFPQDAIIINTDNYEEEIRKYKNEKPINFLVYTVFREKDALRVIHFINLNYHHPENILTGYSKTACIWTKQGLFQEIELKIPEKKLDEVWVICSSESDRSTMSIINEIRENNAEAKIIKKPEDIPPIVDYGRNIGVLMAPIPLPKKALEIKEKIRNLYDFVKN